MNNEKKVTRLVLHISEELNQRLLDASVKNKLSVGSVIRKALEQYLGNTEKGGKQ
jgi:hypothetical protein